MGPGRFPNVATLGRPCRTSKYSAFPAAFFSAKKSPRSIIQKAVAVAKLLIVEDDSDSRDVLAAAFSKAGHDVQGAPNGRQALSAILDDTPDLVVLDLLLP